MDFSIIIPAYNCEKTIIQTVDSIEAVRYDSMEIILVDDGSTDSTYEKCEQIANKYSNVMCYHKENAGVSSARNHGVKYATGEYVLFWDSDDIANPTLLRKCMLKAFEQEADMLIFGIMQKKTYKGKLIQIEALHCNEEELINKSSLASKIVDLFDVNYLSSACNKILKRTICKTVCFDTSKKIFEDLLFVLVFLKYCEKVYILPDLAYVYQVELPIVNSSKTKCISDFNIYMKEYQNVVICLEKQLDTELVELRKRIFFVYELILQDKLNNSSYRELKSLDSTRLKISLFGKLYDPSFRINRLFFSKRIVALKLLCYYNKVLSAIKLGLKSFRAHDS